MHLAKPYNLLMPFRGHTFTVEVLGHLEGEIPIRPVKDGPMKDIPCLRLLTRRLDKPSPAMWVDVTCTAPAAMLIGFVRAGNIVGRAIEFSCRGRGPTRRDTLHITPRVPS